MGLLLSVLITCVGVLEVIACYTHFRVGVAYNECKSNIRDIAKYYAVELRKHELHFEPGPDTGGGAGPSQQQTLSELIRKRNRTTTVRVQESSQCYTNGQVSHTISTNGHAIGASCSNTPDEGPTPTYSHLPVPRNSISGLDSPTVQNLISPDVNITEAIAEKIQHLENNDTWSRKSPSPIPERTGLEVVDKDFWRSRSPSPFPEVNNDANLELKYTPGLRNYEAAHPVINNTGNLLESPVIPGNLHRSPSGSELVDKDFWNKTIAPSDSDITYSKTDLEIQNILPSDSTAVYSVTDLEVQTLTQGLNQNSHVQPSIYPEVIFGMTGNNEESKFNEDFLRSLDGVKSSKCDDKRRSFRKKRNSSSTSSRASRDDVKSITSVEDLDLELNKKPEDIITPLTEEDTEFNLIQNETIISEKCESLKSPPPLKSMKESPEEIKVTQQEQTHFKASESSSNAELNKPTNLSFTEKVKDLEISVQLMVTVKGTSQGDQMQYTTSVTQDNQSKQIQPQPKLDDTVTKTTEEKSEFGKVKTSVTYGQNKLSSEKNSSPIEDIKTEKCKELKDLQISSQSLIHAERAVQDKVKSSEDEFMKLYESFTELSPREKNKFLKIIDESNKDQQDISEFKENLECPPQDINTEKLETATKDNLSQNTLQLTSSSTNKLDTEKKSQNIREKSKTPDPSNNEIILIKEITEITESTETVMKIPPSKTESNHSKLELNENKQSTNIEEIQQQTITKDNTICATTNDKEIKSSTDNQIINNSDTFVTAETSDKVINKQLLEDKSVILENQTEISSSLESPRTSNEFSSDNINRNESTPSEISSKEETITITEIPQKEETNVKEDINLQIDKNTKESISLNEKTTVVEEEKKKTDSSSSSSETPSTVVENVLRRASKTSFEDASLVQNQEMMKRRVSNSEISPKQATQAFWLIFSAEYTNAMEKDWHGQHFSCWQCDESLTGQRYVLREEHPYCVKCYEQVFANTCEKCNRIIGIDSKDLSYKEKHWHEACFQCTTCNESLVDKQFGAKGEKIYCGNCYDKQFASRCDGCGKIFHAGTKKMEYKNRQWHEQCFKCCKCDTPIGTKSFIPREKDIYCAGCYEEKFATRCVKCKKAIQSGGVTYKNEPWHRECFTCTHCDKNLAGQRFTSRDDKPCCAECFGRLFAKRCTSCNEPITGIGGTRFISFEDRHWHNDCFICASCSTSLVGRGFITDEDKIICPECAKERFM